MQFMGLVLRWFEVGDANTLAARALLIEQFRIFAKQIPILYLVLIVDSLSIAYAMPATVPWMLRFGVPCAVLTVSISRLVYWLGVKATPDAHVVLKLFSRVRILTAVLNLAFTVWGMALIANVDARSQAVVSLLIYTSAVGSAYCVGAVPSIAWVTLLLSALPMALRLLLSDDAILVCVGINLTLLSALLVVALNTYHKGLVKLVASRAEIMAEQERAARAEVVALEEQAAAGKLAARFDTAINNMSQGLCFFDGAERLIVCNRRYIEMYGLAPDRVRAGTTLREIVDLRCEAAGRPTSSWS